MLEIITGQKAIPLSIAEEKEKAKVTVELYGETAHLARSMCNSIRKTHHGDKYYSHNDYEKFNKVRQERNSFAQTIVENYVLHREFIFFMRVYGINSKMIEAQSRQFRDSQSTDKYSEKTHDFILYISYSSGDKMWGYYSMCGITL